MPVTLHWVHKRQSERGGLWGPPFSLFRELQQSRRGVIPEQIGIADIGLQHIHRLVP
jgi:hypothetical protein